MKEQNEWSFKSFDYKDGDAKYRSYLTDDNGFHLFFDCYDRKADMKYILHRKLDRQGSISPVKVLSSLAVDKEDEGHFTIVHSKDSMMTLVHNARTEDDDRIHGLSFALFDNEMNKVWEELALAPYPDDQVFTVTEAVVSNSGEAFLLGYLKPKTEASDLSEEEEKRNRITTKYKIYRIRGGEKIREYDLSAFDEAFFNPTIEADINGNLILMGLYEDTISKSVSGCVYVSLDQKSLQSKVERVYEFDDTFLSSFVSDKNIIEKLFFKKPEGFDEYYFQDFVVWPDSSVTILMEQNYDRLKGSENPFGAGYYYREYYSNDIIAFHIDPEENMQWVTIIPKKQKGNIGAMSYLLIKKKGEIELIFNNNEDDVELYYKGEEPRGLNGHMSKNTFAVSRVSLRKDGTFDYEKLLSTENHDGFSLPVKKCIFLSPKTIFTLYVKTFKMKMAKLELED